MDVETASLFGETAALDRRKVARNGLLVFALAITLNLAGNASIGLWDRDEPRFSGAVREMRAHDDWVTPTFNGVPRYHKPILIYWIMGVGTSIFGDNPFGLRIGSAIAGASACAATWWLGRRMLGESAALLGAVALATSPLMFIESKIATVDATLAFLVVLCQICLWELSRRPSRWISLTFWTALGLATLAKGPSGPVLIAAAGVAAWWFRGPTACWKRLGWGWGLCVFAAITVPWYAAIAITSGGEFYRFAVGSQVIGRITGELEEHGGFPLYYLVTTMLSFYPWSALAPAAMIGAWIRRKTSPAFGFLLGWALGPMVVLELMRTKLIHYYLPCLPALALGVGWIVHAVARDVMTLRRWPGGRFAVGAIGGLGVTIAAGLLAGTFILPGPLRAPLFLLGILVAVATLGALWLIQRGEPLRAAWGLAGCWAVVMLATAGWLLPAAEPYRLARIVGEKLGDLATREDATPVLVTFQEPNVLYALNRVAPTMWDWNDVFAQLHAHRRLVAPLTPRQFAELAADGRFAVDSLEDVSGFNVNKGSSQTLRLARITLSPQGVARLALEQPLVK